jgi:hypothetical protein
MKTFAYLLAVITPLLSVSPGIGQENPFRVRGDLPPSELVMGRQGTIDLSSGKMKGELLSVTSDSLWVLSEGGVSAHALRDVRRVDVRMHRWGARRVITWNLIAGLGSALALTAACNSVEGSGDCGAVFAYWSLGWALWGGLSGVALTSSAKRTVPPSAGALQPYVRYPQGPPPGGLPGPGPRGPGG